MAVALTATLPETVAPAEGAVSDTAGGVVSACALSVSVTGTVRGEPWAPAAVTVTAPV